MTDRPLPHTIRESLQSGPPACEEVARRIRARWQAILALKQAPGGDPAWIHVATPEQIDAQLEALASRDPANCPLYGISFAVKDNIDVAGWPTTAACPGFAHVAERTAEVVRALLEAGAILLGKTNLDQFATGLVGTRSPYGAVPNAFSPDHVSGGSSSGSASVVARGLVHFSLGTDTAGSGRVPAGFNNLVGLKPTPGLVSNEGVLPACRTLDCVSVFALTADDAALVFEQIEGNERTLAATPRFHPPVVPRLDFGPAPRLGVPDAPVFGSEAWREAFGESVARASGLGLPVSQFEMAPLSEVARLLYEGPWVVERRIVAGDAIVRGADGIDPVVAKVISAGGAYTAADAFSALYRVREIGASLAGLWDRFDALMVPTAPGLPTIAAVAAEPIARNSELGFYTNFVNLLGWSAVAVPAGFTPDGLPFGVTFIGPGGADRALLALAARWQRALGLPLGRRLAPIPAAPDEAPPSAAPAPRGTVRLAVVGAHLRGMPLHWQLVEAGAAFVAETATSARYRLYALAGTEPAKPGLVRTAEGGVPIALELYDVPLGRFGAFVAQVPPPLGIGNVELADGSWVKGFVCEPWALAAASDISAHGGWRAWLAAR
ncbi:allophanate hydrolase [Burkholderiaceae bacterium FT117]|uniref:allophanate hydrolase n=1 Tax=Zeimonas sediminis TaxID=2944268 RepID=UPI002342F109|nr:allophanate hydrolase [Zeimonas sediminis]MCM5569791.1 allophanate hydrolase [Zeimonas sediminis]